MDLSGYRQAIIHLGENPTAVVFCVVDSRGQDQNATTRNESK